MGGATDILISNSSINPYRLQPYRLAAKNKLALNQTSAKSKSKPSKKRARPDDCNSAYKWVDEKMIKRYKNTLRKGRGVASSRMMRSSEGQASLFSRSVASVNCITHMVMQMILMPIILMHMILSKYW